MDMNHMYSSPRHQARCAAIQKDAAVPNGTHLAPQEVCLHPLVAGRVDATVILEAVRTLSPRQALALLRYLAACLRLHAELLGGWMHPPGRRRRGGRRSGLSLQHQRHRQPAEGNTQGSAALASADAASEPLPMQNNLQQDPGKPPAGVETPKAGSRRSTRSRSKPAASSRKQKSSGPATASDTTMELAYVASQSQNGSNGPTDGSSQPAVSSAGGGSGSASQKPDDSAEAAAPAAPQGGGWPVPPLAHVLEWAAAVLDAQLISLAPSAATQEVRIWTCWVSHTCDIATNH